MWIKKNWFTLVGILFIILFTIFNLATIEKQKNQLVEQCNEHWRASVYRACPILASQELFAVGVQGENISENWWNIS